MAARRVDGESVLSESGHVQPARRTVGRRPVHRGDTARPAVWPDEHDSRPSSTRPVSSPATSTRCSSSVRATPALAARRFDVCHPALALRAVLCVQAVLAVGALLGAQPATGWRARRWRCSPGWPRRCCGWSAVCACKRWLARRRAGGARRGAAGAGRGCGAARLAAAVPGLDWSRRADCCCARRWRSPARPVRRRCCGPGSTCARACGSRRSQRAAGRAAVAHPAALPVQRAEHRDRAGARRPGARRRRARGPGAAVSRRARRARCVGRRCDEEIDLAQRYLAIEQVRFGGACSCSWDIDAARRRRARAAAGAAAAGRERRAPRRRARRPTARASGCRPACSAATPW